MIECLDFRSPPVPGHLSSFSQSIAFGRAHWKRLREDPPVQPFILAASRQPKISRFAFTPEKVMPAQRDDSPVRHPRATQSMALLGLQGRWYDRMNRTGPIEPPIPFVDGRTSAGHVGGTKKAQTLADDPPFYLQKPPSDGASMRFRQTEQSSSRPGQDSQPPPLSHSLLSQLELNENDPNTFREVIDDLTVQNKKLKKHLRRYKRMYRSQLDHEGLFEIRVRNVSPKQKQKLEILLQQFASNVQSSEHESVRDAVRGKNQAVGDTDASQSPSPHGRLLDSTYASVSTTRGATKQTPAPLTRASDRMRNRLEAPANPSSQAIAHAVPQEHKPPDISSVSDRSKQKLIVQRLEGLFLGEEIDEATFSEGNDSNESQEQRRRASDSLDTPQATSSADSLHYLRHLGLASPPASISPPSHDEWIYLNLLINMAKLHTLNVTPDFVRQAIRTVSARLVLSEDGGKIRWQGNLTRTVINPDRIGNNSLIETSPSADPESARGDQPQRIPSGDFSVSHRDRGPGAEGVGDPQRTIRLTARTPRETRATQLHYKPLFAHTKRRRARSDYESHDGSSDGNLSSSESEGASMSPHDTKAGRDPSNGSLVFFRTQPFFLDLSADVVEAGHLAHSTYSTSTAEPLGRETGTLKASRDYERKRELNYGAHPQTIQSLGRDSLSHTASPLLRVYNDDPTHSNTSHGTEKFHFEASGIGGIQLDDNFAIHVETSHQPHPNLRQQGSTTRHRLHDTIARSVTRDQRASGTGSRSHEILSTTTTRLAPSPLPPPSYVYPAISSSSSEIEADYDSLDDTDSESDLDFRRVSLSPQMRTYLEQQQEVSGLPYANTYTAGQASTTAENESEGNSE